ncbi:acyloxyacyl hydrolase [Candidatus Omnitrophota bacterium]
MNQFKQGGLKAVCVKKWLFVLILSILFLSATTSNSYCDTEGLNQEETAEYLNEFGIYSGWASGKLKYFQGDYETVPLHFQIGFDITSLLNDINIHPPGRLKFLFEPFINTVLQPDANVEVGNNFMLKYTHPIIQQFSLFIEGGLGLLYTTQHTYEQGTQFNFSQQIGGGISYQFAENKAINFGYRRRHFSNCDIDEPNAGIDMDYFLFGVSIFY